ncbi:hypothetical protein FKM82_016155 [Ascaphus truei]
MFVSWKEQRVTICYGDLTPWLPVLKQLQLKQNEETLSIHFPVHLQIWVRIMQVQRHKLKLNQHYIFAKVKNTRVRLHPTTSGKSTMTQRIVRLKYCVSL